MRKKKTAAMALFGLLNNMSKIMKDVGDEHYSNILKHICDEYAVITIKMEKEQIIDAWIDGFKSSAEGWNGEMLPYYKDGKQTIDEYKEEYYKETYGK